MAGLPDRHPGPDADPIAVVVSRMQRHADRLPPSRAHLAAFLSTYQRTTVAVGDAIAAGAFLDPRWVQAWDVAFADLYLGALDAEIEDSARVPRPWQVAFDASPGLPDLRHVLLGINAHVNYDLPQALLAVIPERDFADTALLARRRVDHERIDGVLSRRVAAEDDQLATSSRKNVLDRLLTPLNRWGSRRFLREARQKVWHNTVELHLARSAGEDDYRARLAELEILSAAKVADLLEPGQVLLRLAVTGFGVTLPPPDDGRRPRPR